ncbi:MAG: L-aspartate oxidase [Gammaproteobacteria bacterium]|nr:L-aspartate oxidase [Gammaproteobacteria bacterium]
MAKRYRADVLTIGSGAAGLATALHLADRAKVTVLSKDALRGGSTNRAQGGVAAVTAPDDSFDAHVEDTMAAGAGLCVESAVRMTVARAPQAIEHVVGLGLEFDRAGNAPHLTREGGHSHRRVLHVADATGAAIARTLIERASAHPNIDIVSGRVAIDLITAAKLGERTNRTLGAYVYDVYADAVDVFEADFVVLATGGASKAYLYTSNPDGATGDGIAMAWRAGCRVANMEFNQFHPTCLYHPASAQTPGSGSFLISEAVRGEGGRLLLPDGSQFIHRFDKRAELASRDIVARAIDHEMKRLGADCVYLDISHKNADFIAKHFPTIHGRCLELGIDITKEPIPVVPAAHYTCGGAIVDLNSRTDLPGLYAVGETAYTGLHGANRLASNSLLECLVFAEAAAQDILSTRESAPRTGGPVPPDWDESQVSDSDEQVVLSHNWTELRRAMWDYVGIVRTNKRLERAERRIDLLKREIHDYYARHRVSADLIELRNLVHVAALIVRSAAMRKESRGLHYTLDYPGKLPNPQPSIVFPAADPLDVLQPFPARPSRARRNLANRSAS